MANTVYLSKRGKQVGVSGDGSNNNSSAFRRADCQDLATQIFHWDEFRRSCKEHSVTAGKYLSVAAAEYLSGHREGQYRPKHVCLSLF